MNEQLRFSWGHIIAFLAVIAVSYFSFVGATYYFGGDFVKAAIVTLAVDIVLLAVFIFGMQVAKATTRHFSRWIWLERLSLVASPVVFVVAMLPYFHAWSVHEHNDEIAKSFSGAIASSKGMFTEYESYANQRINRYDVQLDYVAQHSATDANAYATLGFNGNVNPDIQRTNMVDVLRLQLLSCNYDSLKHLACAWIDGSCDGVSTWNVFLLGNISQVKQNIHCWNEQLLRFAAPRPANEVNSYVVLGHVADTTALAFRSRNFEAMDKGLDGIVTTFTQSDTPSLVAILLAFLIYAALFFPYLLQDRHTKSTYKLFGRKPVAGIGIFNFERDNKKKGGDSHSKDASSPTTHRRGDRLSRAGRSDADDWGIFTMKN